MARWRINWRYNNVVNSKKYMRIKPIISLLIASVLTVACEKHTQENKIPGALNSYIFFEPSVNVTVDTKALIVDGETLPSNNTEFGVIGVYEGKQIFSSSYDKNIAKVYKKSGSSVYSYDYLAQWKGDNDHKFYAFYPYALTGVIDNTGENSGENAYIQYEQPKSPEGMIDILTAATSTKKTGTVPVKFQHRLWALDVKVVNNSGKALIISSIIVTVKDFYNKANISLSGSIADTEINNESDLVVLKKDDSYTNVQSNSTYQFNPLLFLPKEDIEYKIEIRYLNSWGNIVTFKTEFTKSDKEFLAGYRYPLIITKESPSTTFDVKMGNKEGWESVNVNHEFN